MFSKCTLSDRHVVLIIRTIVSCCAVDPRAINPYNAQLLFWEGFRIRTFYKLAGLLEVIHYFFKISGINIVGVIFHGNDQPIGS
jgi:hypothetical protein